jgi:type I site-specific restriction endonuclease
MAFSLPTRSCASISIKTCTGWRPDKGMIDKHGNEIEDRIYNQRDFDKNLVLEKRTELVAKKISDFLKQPIASTKPLFSATTSTTPSGCGRR